MAHALPKKITPKNTSIETSVEQTSENNGRGATIALQPACGNFWICQAAGFVSVVHRAHCNGLHHHHRDG